MAEAAAQAGDVLSFTCAQMLFGGLFQLVHEPGRSEWAHFDPMAVSVSSWLALLYLVVFGSIVGLNCYLWLLTRVPAPKVTTYALVNPVVALILGALILDEEITAWRDCDAARAARRVAGAVSGLEAGDGGSGSQIALDREVTMNARCLRIRERCHRRQVRAWCAGMRMV